MASRTKAVEVRFAYSFLRAIHANLNNTYLLLAIIAWVRSESGSNYIGNNPLNLRPGLDDARWRTGVRVARNGNGRFSVYGSLEAAAAASANRLLRAGNDYRGYGSMVRAAQRAASGTKAMQGQAIDFLWALALSKWDAGHYGLDAKERKEPSAIYTTTLYRVWAGLTGSPVTIPGDVINPKKKPPVPKKPPPKATPVAVLQPPQEKRDYISAASTKAFYEARHGERKGYVGDPDQTGL